MHDHNGERLKVGDIISIPCLVTGIMDSEENFCNVSLESIHGRRPDDQKEHFCLNTGHLLLVCRSE